VDGEVTECGICGNGELNLILDLGEQPLAERMEMDAPCYPLGLLRCRDCGLLQLSWAVDQRELFPRDHPYATGNSQALRRHYIDLRAQVSSGLHLGDLVVDIGANDGTFLSLWDPRQRRLAIEPTAQAVKCQGKGIPVEQEFFTAELAGRLRDEHGEAKLITACNVLAHVPDPHDFMEGVMTLLADDGVFVTENGLASGITDELQYDSIYHEHLRYYSVETLARLASMHGMQITSVEHIPIHGGSFRTRITKRQGELDVRAHRSASMLHSLLKQISERGQVTYGVGAATRASTLIHFAGIGRYLAAVCETPGSDKIGHVMPGTAIPVIPDAKLIADQPDYALVLAWQIAGDLIPALKQKGYLGQFIVPLPEPRII
jgi:SAM-dependent methyltransferase